MRIIDLEQLRDQTTGRINLNLIENPVLEANVRGRRFKRWLILEEGRILFKECDPNTYEDYAQIFSAEFLKACGLPTAQYDLALFEDKVGVITRDFAPGQLLISGDIFLTMANMIGQQNNSLRVLDNNVEDIVYAFSLQPHRDVDIIRNKELLIKKIIIDGILLETDFNNTNWSNISGPYATLAPFYDGSSTCRLGKTKDSCHGLAINLRDESTLASLIDESKRKMHINSYFVDKPFIEEFEYICANHPDVVFDVFERALNANVIEIITRIEQKTKVDLPYDCSLLLRMIIRYNIEFLKIIYEKYRINQQTPADDTKLYIPGK